MSHPAPGQLFVEMVTFRCHLDTKKKFEGQHLVLGAGLLPSLLLPFSALHSSWKPGNTEKGPPSVKGRQGV